MPAAKSPKRSAASRSAEMDALKKNARKRTFRAGQVVFREGDQGDALYVIEEGRVQISALIGNQESRVFSHFGPGEYFGEMAVIDSRPRSATATAAVDTIVSVIPHKKVWETFERSPKLLVAMIREFSTRMREFDRRYLYEVFQQERLAMVGRFAQSIVHDFTNPLSNIGFAADLACAGDATRKERTQAKATIRKQVDRLSDMIGELLEFTRGPSGSVALALVNYRQFVERLISDLASEVEQRSVQILCENPPPEIPLPLDRRRLAHVFLNLINNAIAFMPGGGKIVLRFAVSDDEVNTEVEDTGSGIAPEIAGRLFEPFATHGKRQGTGLGLSICKRIIEDHGGRISARTESGRGAIFTFTLPRRTPPKH
ncbi:MAG: ATP-binding protein [Chthoniobacteraceae bacterium]